MQLPPKLQLLLQSKQGRIKLAAAAGVALLLLILLFSGSEDTPPPIATQSAQQQEEPPPPAPPNAGNSQIILELFNPSDEALTHQQNETTYSQQIEQTMTVTFLLTQCQIISKDDYSNIFQALIFYANHVKLAPDAAGAEARVREIAELSKASYSLVYSRISCEDPQLNTLARQALEWADTIFKLN